MSTIDIRRAAQYATVAENAAAQCVIVADNLQNNVEGLTGQATAAAQQAVASQNAAKASETAAKSSETSASASASSAAQSAAEAAGSAAATGYVAPPFPDVWAPLSDDLKMIAGYPVNTKLISFTRASTATYIDKSGVLQTAAINEPRFEKEGLLIEGASANLFLNSSDPSKWGNSALLSKTQQPDGLTQAMTGVFTASSDISNAANIITNTANPAALSAGGQLSGSCNAKSSYGRLRFRVQRASGEEVGNCVVDLTTGQLTPASNIALVATLKSDGYYRVEATFTAADADNYVVQFRYIPAAGSSVIPQGSVIYLQMPQLEAGGVSSYIPTTDSAVTRATDDCYAQRSGNDNYFGPVTIAAEVHCNGQTATDGAASSRRGILAAYPTTSEFILMMVDSTTTTLGKYAFAYGSSTFNYSDNRIDDGQIHTICSRSTTSQNQSCVDGTQLTIPTTVSRPTPGTTSSVNQLIYIGRGAGVAASGARMLNGHIRNLRIWHRALSDIQMKGIR